MDVGTACEIERKFVLDRLPPRDLLGEGTRVRQFYLPGDTGEIRARQKGPRYFLTAKDDGALVRKEWEVEISEWVFALFHERGRERGVEKTRHHVKHGEHTLIVDDYDGALSGLVTLECEFDSETSAAALVLPAWAARAVEVTHDPRYKNRALALGRDPRREAPPADGERRAP